MDLRHRGRAGHTEHGPQRPAATPLSGRRDRLNVYRQLRNRYRPSRSEFERLVADSIADLPESFRTRMENVAVIVTEWPSDEQTRSIGLDECDDLLGLYQGTPIGERGGGYHLVPPDRITIYRQPILRMFRTEQEVRKEIRDTVLHEIGHLFGLSDEELE